MRIPKSLKEVLVKDYIKINKIRSAEYDNPFTRTIDLLCIFNKREDVLKCKPSELAIDLSHLLVEPSRILKQYFTINGKRYGIVNHINDLEAGQYMSFTTYLKGFADNPNVHIEQMPDILASVIFPVDKNNKVMAIEPSYFRNLADDIRNTVTIDEIYGVAVFLQSISELNDLYSGLFESEIGNDDGAEQERNIGGSEGFGERWGWIATLDSLCNGDFTKRPYYEKMNVIEFLNICSYVKEKQKAEAAQRRIEELKRR